MLGHVAHDLAPSKKVFRSLALGDVGEHRKGTGEIARAVRQNSRRDIRQEDAAITTAKTMLICPVEPSLALGHGFLMGRQVLLEHEGLDLLADNVRRFVTQHVGHSPVDKGHPVVTSHYTDAFGGRFENSTIMRFALPQRIFDTFAFGDVLDKALVVGRLSVKPRDASALERHPYSLSIFPNEPALVAEHGPL